MLTIYCQPESRLNLLAYRLLQLHHFSPWCAQAILFQLQILIFINTPQEKSVLQSCFQLPFPFLKLSKWEEGFILNFWILLQKQNKISSTVRRLIWDSRCISGNHHSSVQPDKIDTVIFTKASNKSLLSLSSITRKSTRSYSLLILCRGHNELKEASSPILTPWCRVVSSSGASSQIYTNGSSIKK